ncbi:MAG: DUF2842 domain-containing protein [Janthinobacterium lividum]
MAYVDRCGVGASPRVLYDARMTPSYRKPVGALVIVTGALLYANIVGRLAATLGALPWFVAVPLYIVLGIAWIAPLKPLLQWMETGKWRSPR